MSTPPTKQSTTTARGIVGPLAVMLPMTQVMMQTLIETVAEALDAAREDERRTARKWVGHVGGCAAGKHCEDITCQHDWPCVCGLTNYLRGAK